MNELAARLAGKGFRRAWAIDFEFRDNVGNIPTVVCMVAKCLITGEAIRLWEDELRTCPFTVDDDTLFIAYFASAEVGCFEALGWPRPRNLIDLYVEYRLLTNIGTHDDADNSLLIDLIFDDDPHRRPRKQTPKKRNRLIDALVHFGLPTIGAEDKQVMVDRILRGPPWVGQEKPDILEYCEGDVEALRHLAPVLVRREHYPRDDDLARAMYRGRFMVAVGVMETIGTPIDKPLLDRLLHHWEPLKLRLIGAIDPLYGVYEGDSFKEALFEAYLEREGIPWPRYKSSGRLVLKEAVFKQMSDIHPQLSPLRELRHTMGQLRLNKMKVGCDRRNRTLLRPFSAKTSRNQPSSNEFIFGNSVWLRGLIRPGDGFAVAYVDWSAQEIAIAAALSGDERLWQSYASGDPYIDFALVATMVPASVAQMSLRDAKLAYRRERESCKQLFLGINYGMGEEGISVRAGLHVAEARRLLAHHRRMYPVFWAWTEANVTRARLGHSLATVFDWRIHFPADPAKRVNPRSIMNWPMQAHGAEMMRLAVCLAIEEGLRICAPVHDAFLLEAPIGEIEEQTARLVEIMGDASEVVLGAGRRCRCGFDIIRAPGRYQDSSGRGTIMFRRVMRLLDELEAEEAEARASGKAASSSVSAA